MKVNRVKQPIKRRLKVKKLLTSSVTCDAISFFAIRKCQKIRKIDEKSYPIDGENLHIFWTTWRILMMTFSGKMWLMIILKLKLNKNTKKKQGLILSLKNTFLEKPGGECQTEPQAF